MKRYGMVSLFEEALCEPKALWEECVKVGWDGLVVGVRDAATFASFPIAEAISFRDQCDALDLLYGSRPPGIKLVPCPYDASALAALRRHGADALWLPPSISHQAALVGATGTLGVALFVVVNGLGVRGFEDLLKACHGRAVTLCYQSIQAYMTSTLMQLAWLRAQEHPIGLMSDDEVELQMAAALGADVLVSSRRRIGQLDWPEVAAGLERLADAAQGNGPRPITREELDALSDALPSLVATRRLEPGQVLTKADIAVRVVRRKGLAPFMLDTIVGRRLRYSIEEGEPLSFGFLTELDGEN